MIESDKIELRSMMIRRIIGKIPLMLTALGTIMMLLAVLLVVVVFHEIDIGGDNLWLWMAKWARGMCRNAGFMLMNPAP